MWLACFGRQLWACRYRAMPPVSLADWQHCQPGISSKGSGRRRVTSLNCIWTSGPFHAVSMHAEMWEFTGIAIPGDRIDGGLRQHGELIQFVPAEQMAMGLTGRTRWVCIRRPLGDLTVSRPPEPRTPRCQGLRRSAAFQGHLPLQPGPSLWLDRGGETATELCNSGHRWAATRILKLINWAAPFQD